MSIYRVGGYYATGAFYTHLVGANHAKEAMKLFCSSNR